MLEIKSLADFGDDVSKEENLGAEGAQAVEGYYCRASRNTNGSSEKTITKMTGGMRDTNRVNVFLDGKFAFSLDVAQVVELQVKVGQKVDAERLKVLRSASEFGKLYQRTLEWVLGRPHSIREARDYLRRRQQKRIQVNCQRRQKGEKEFPEISSGTAELVIERLLERGYLDDRKFAEYFVENRFVKKGISKKRLRMELQKKGVAAELIEAALMDIGRNDYDELQKMLIKKRARYDDQKLIAYLVRQGFNYEEVKEAVKNSQR